MSNSQFTVKVCDELRGIKEPQSGDVYKVIDLGDMSTYDVDEIPDDFFVVNHVRALLDTGGNTIINYEMDITLASMLITSLSFIPGTIGMHRTESTIPQKHAPYVRIGRSKYEFFGTIPEIGFSDVIRFPVSLAILVDYVRNPDTWRDIWQKTLELQ